MCMFVCVGVYVCVGVGVYMCACLKLTPSVSSGAPAQTNKQHTFREMCLNYL